jgi:transketolase
LFCAQDADYRQQVLPIEVGARVAVEAAQEDYWYKFVGLEGRVVGMTTFGESAPGDELMEYFGFTVDNVVATVEEVLD